jgi:hypothetical protein
VQGDDALNFFRRLFASLSGAHSGHREIPPIFPDLSVSLALSVVKIPGPWQVINESRVHSQLLFYSRR